MVIGLADSSTRLQSFFEDPGLDQKFLEDLSIHVFDSLTTTESLGRSFIVEKDRVLSPTRVITGSREWFVCDDKVVRVAFDLIPEDALRYLREKALTIAGVEYKELLNEVRDTIANAIEQGIPFSELKDEIDILFESYGVTPLDPGHLKTVFQTNLFTSYAVGQLEQAQSMSDRFPLWRYSAIRDDRTRPSHLALNGNIYRVGEGPVPPIDYNCRCTANYLHISEVEAKGLQPLEWQGDSGFVRFTSRQSWEDWKASKADALTPDVQAWIQDNM